MAGRSGISEWVARTCGLKTVRGWVDDALDEPARFADYLGRYRASSEGYLDWLLLRHKIVLDSGDRQRAVRQIWTRVIAAMPGRLKAEWRDGRKGFRDLLCEAIHACCHDWQRGEYTPPSHGLASPVPGDDAQLLLRQREEVLEKARGRLLRHKEGTVNGYYEAFRAWEADKDAPRQTLNHRMARATGRRPLDPQDFRKTLSRAWDLFGRYLAEEVSGLFDRPDKLDVEALRVAFERLDLMEEYAVKFRHCRALLDLPADE